MAPSLCCSVPSPPLLTAPKPCPPGSHQSALCAWASLRFWFVCLICSLDLPISEITWRWSPWLTEGLCSYPGSQLPRLHHCGPGHLQEALAVGWQLRRVPGGLGRTSPCGHQEEKGVRGQVFPVFTWVPQWPSAGAGRGSGWGPQCRLGS